MAKQSKLAALESVRGLSTLYVVAGHWVLHHFSNPGTKAFFALGQEAVISFFLLSGFVIHYSWEKGKESSLYNYFIKRFRRIYFPFAMALLVTFLLVRPDVFPWRELAGNLLMLQDFGAGKPGNIVDGFLGNTPLWSLSYETSFYLFFPFAYRALKSSRNRVDVIGITALVFMGLYMLLPNHLLLMPAYFLIWWVGLELSGWLLFTGQTVHLKKCLRYLALMLVLIGAVAWRQGGLSGHLQPGVYPLLFVRHFGAAGAFILILMAWRKLRFAGLRLIDAFAVVAPISYSLYVLHYPVLVQWDFAVASPVLTAVIHGAVLVAACILVEIYLQPKVNKLLRTRKTARPAAPASIPVTAVAADPVES